MTIDEAVQHYIAAFDTLDFVAEQVAEMCLKAKSDEDHSIALDYLEAMMEKAEELRDSVEGMIDDVRER